MKSMVLKLFGFLFAIVSMYACVNTSVKLDDSEDVEMMSYMIEYKTTVEQENLKGHSLMIQWVDNVNHKYSVYTKTDTEITGRKLSGESLMIHKGGWSYVLNLTEKSGFKSKSEGHDDLITSYIRPADKDQFKKMIEEENGKITGEGEFLGRNCIIVERPERDESGMKTMTKMWYYNGIPLKISNTSSLMEAISFDENVHIPSDKFEVPEGIEVKTIPSL